MWIAFTLFAVVMQTVRTAGQKHLTLYLDPVAVTLVRFVFGLPFAFLYLAAVMAYSGRGLPRLNLVFAGFSLVAALTQIAATVLLIYLFSLRNFAVGTAYARTEAFLTAALGALVFGELVTGTGWLAIALSVAGVLVLTVARTGIAGGALVARLCNRAALVGLASGLCFAVCSLSLRRASLSLGDGNFLFTAGVTLVTMVTIQSVFMVAYVGYRNARQLRAIARQWRLSLFIGATSALGSIGWFTAMTLERASYVKALGQIEFVLALAISTLFFRERSSAPELAGMGLVAAGVVILVLAG